MMKKTVMLSLFFGLSLVVVSAFFVHKKLSRDNLAFYEDKFQLLTILRKDALEAHINTVQGEILFWSKSTQVLEAAQDFQDAWLELDGDPSEALRRRFIRDNPYSLGQRRRLVSAGDDSDYSDTHEEFHPLGVELVIDRGYYDFFLIDPLGNIVYSVEKEADYATNLAYGKYAESGLGHVFRKAVEQKTGQTHIVDFDSYAPSNGAPAIFIARRLVDQSGVFLGVVALQLSNKAIMKIMQFGGGVGEYGETYLVGADKLMRSNSRFSSEPTALTQRVDSPVVDKALAGEFGVELTTNYLGNRTLSAYNVVEMGGFQWAVIAETPIAEIEAVTPVSRLKALFGALLAAFIGIFGTAVSIAIRKKDGQQAFGFSSDWSG